MATKKPQQTFTISAKITVESGVTVKAASFTEAVELAKNLDWSDFVQAADGAAIEDWSKPQVTFICADYGTTPPL